MFSVAPVDGTWPTMTPAKAWLAGREPAGGPAGGVTGRVG